jgi:altronate hydrolase
MTPFIRLHPADDVLIARVQLVGGTQIENIFVKGLIPPGHKVAAHALAQGDSIRRYNQIIGFASQAIAPGEHVHTHNLDMGPDKGDFARDYAIGADVKPAPARREASFMGIRRPDGRVATRNYIGILSSVNCSATAARAIADHFSRKNNPSALRDFPNVDGVVALTHGTGCGMDSEGAGMKLLQRTLAGTPPTSILPAPWWWGWAARPTRSTPGWPTALCAKARTSASSISRTAAARAGRWTKALP